MAQDFSPVIEGIRKRAVLMQSELDFAAVLEQAQSAINSAEQAKQLSAQALAERDATLVDLKKAQTSIVEAKASAAQIVADANEKASKVRADADDAAVAKLAAAQRAADDLVAGAQAEANRISAAAAQSRLDAAQDVAATLSKAKDAEAACITAQFALDELNDKLAKAKAAAAAMFQ